MKILTTPVLDFSIMAKVKIRRKNFSLEEMTEFRVEQN